ncbi:stage II sporulation protein M [Candidatus Palauibacter sp.]|uniref:stage II sporulation protein M n=1 Tax=Candidatus Palauibacter sp. TaxID=3101350 RepID=UPI003B01CC11
MAHPRAALHRSIALETPEHVRLEYQLADLGSRAAALALDLAIIAATILLVGLVLRFTGLSGGAGAGFGVAVLYIVLFFATWGYFLCFEAVWDGRTPGKRALGLRVLHAGGEPLSFQGSVLRNLIRVVDLQPGLTGMAGAATILFNRRAQRLGDLVAGTIVVRDAGGGEMFGDDVEPTGRPMRPVLSPEQFELLAGYMARREGLQPEVRRRVAGSVWSALREPDEADPAASEADPDASLTQLHEAEAPRHAARRGGTSLQAAAMARERRQAWEAYTALVDKGRSRGLGALTEEEVRAFGRLYRGVTADLARARTYGASPGLLEAVGRWAGSGHNLLYRASGRAAVPLGRWIAREFPRAVRRHHRPALLAGLLLFGPMLASYSAVRDDPVRARAIMPPGMLARAENTARGDPDAAYLTVGAGEMPALSSAVVTNNVGVTFMAFAGGLLAGLGTVLILVFNGVVLGAAFGLYANNEVLGVILAFVFPHGVMELTAICLAGGAGLGLGSALLVPGRRTRREALRERGREFLSLVGGAVLLLLVAGLVEGFYSPSGLPAVAKFAFGSATAVLLAAWFGLAGRGSGESTGSARADVRAAPAP